MRKLAQSENIYKDEGLERFINDYELHCVDLVVPSQNLLIELTTAQEVTAACEMIDLKPKDNFVGNNEDIPKKNHSVSEVHTNTDDDIPTGKSKNQTFIKFYEFLSSKNDEKTFASSSLLNDAKEQKKILPCCGSEGKNVWKENLSNMNLDSVDFVCSLTAKDQKIISLGSSALKQTSLTQLDSFIKSSKYVSEFKQQRPVSFREDGLSKVFLNEKHLKASNFNSKDNCGKISTGVRARTAQGEYMLQKNFNKGLASNMFRKAFSICKLQNVKMKSSVSKFENKFLSTEVVSYSDDMIENTLINHRLSYEDCSSCISCRSRSSSYHSLLYDFETACNYQIYQPTVCDLLFDDDVEDETIINIKKVNESIYERNDQIHSFQKEDLLKQGHATFTRFKEKLRKVKSLKT